MNLLLRNVTISLLLLTSACSTVLEGRTQTIAVDTLPMGADCLIKDNDTVLAKVHTPGTAQISKSKNDILVECTKEGYIPNKLRNRSDIAISSVGNMVLGQYSFIGNMVDSASGASHKYDSKVFMAMNPLPPVALMPVDGAPSIFGQGSATVPDLASLPPEQLAHQLSQLFKTQNVVVSNQPPEEVIRQLAANQSVAGEVVQGLRAQQPQQMAVLGADSPPIQHSAE